jgi:hypothetical protein
MTPGEQYDALAAATDPAVMQATVLKFLFMKTAEIDASLEALTPVIGAIAGRVGVSAAQIRRLTGALAEEVTPT